MLRLNADDPQKLKDNLFFQKNLTLKLLMIAQTGLKFRLHNF